MSYHTRLQRDLERWERAGWVTPDGAQGILAEVATRPTWFAPARLLAMAGAVLLCFGVMLFVASNWQAMSKLARLALLFTGLWGSYGAAAALFQREYHAFGHAAVLVAQGLFGAMIMLIAQMYHMDGHPPDAVLIWALGAGAAGIALRSNASLVLAVLLLGLWTGWEWGLTPNVVHWQFLPAAAALAAGIWWATGWRPALHLLALVTCLFVVQNGFRLPHRTHHHETLLIGGAMVAISLALPHGTRGLAELARSMLVYGFAVAFAGAWWLHFESHEPAYGVPLAAWVALVLACVIGALIEAWRSDNKGLVWVAYGAFAIEIISLYFKTLGSLLSTSVFFLVAGLLVIGLAACAWLLLNRKSYLSEAVS